ncbi:hypothetical protein, partial [Spirosoma gilvum]
ANLVGVLKKSEFSSLTQKTMSEFSQIKTFRPQVKKAWSKPFNRRTQKPASRFPKRWDLRFARPWPLCLPTSV